jgi:hypothetical protein
VRRRDVEKDDLIRALVLIADGELNGIAGVADVEKSGALDDPAFVDVETRDYAFEEHR